MIERRLIAALVVSMVVLSLAPLASPFGVTAARTDDPRIAEIIEKLDDLYRSESSYASIEMEIVTRHWERTLEMQAWTEGQDKTFIRIESPRKEAGMGTLRIDNEMWNYLPRVNKVIKVPPSMMSSSWMGSDFTNDDLVNEVTLEDDYTVEFTTVESPRDSVLYLKATPHDGVPVVWGWYIMAVEEDTYLPLWEEYYDEQGRTVRRAEFSDVRTFDGRTLPTTMAMIPQSEEKKGNRTVIRYKEIRFDIPVEDNVFTLRNLRTPR